MQVTFSGVAYVFDCSEIDPLLVKILSNLKDLISPDLYNESGVTIYDTDPAEQDIRTMLEPTASGAMMVLRNPDSDQILGLYKTYSNLSLSIVDRIRKNNNLETLKDKSVLFDLYGSQTLFEIFADNLHQL